MSHYGSGFTPSGNGRLHSGASFFVLFCFLFCFVKLILLLTKAAGTHVLVMAASILVRVRARVQANFISSKCVCSLISNGKINWSKRLVQAEGILGWSW